MAPTLQKNLPISFVLDDGVGGVTELALPIRPEDLTRTEPSRVAATNTLDGAWLDSFGRGIAQIQINGHTGWGGANRPDGVRKFTELRDNFIHRWHALRESQIVSGRSPDDARLFFADTLNNYCAVVAPQNFVLKRTKSNPLLLFYNLSLLVIDDKAVRSVNQADGSYDRLESARLARGGALSPAGFASFSGSLSSISSISKSLNASIKTIGQLGVAVKSATDSAMLPLLTVTNNIMGLTSQVNGVVDASAGVAMGVAGQVAKAGGALWGAVAAIESIPLNIKIKALQVRSAFENAVCILKNGAGMSGFAVDYSGFYGASHCSSTTGGRPLSPLRNVNGFEVFNQPTPAAFQLDARAIDALRSLGAADPISMPAASQLKQQADAIGSGVMFYA